MINKIYTAITTGSPDLVDQTPPYNPGTCQNAPYDATYNDPDLTAKFRGDIFVAKWNPSGQSIIWCNYLGGPNIDELYGLVVDSQSNVILSGRAGDNFPVTSGVFQNQFMGCSSCGGGPHGSQDAFVAKFTPSGGLAWATYLGSSFGSEGGRDITADSTGNIYLAVHHDGSTSFPFDCPSPVAQKFVNTPLGGGDGVIAKISSDGSQLLWARFMGGTGNHSENAVKVDPSDYPIYAGPDNSGANFVPQPNTRFGPGGLLDLYVARLDPSSGDLLNSSVVGGSNHEGSETNILAVNTAGQVILAGSSTSPDFPVTTDAYDISYNGSAPSNCSNWCGDAVIAVLSNDLSQQIAGTYYGSGGGEQAEGVGVDAAGNVYIGGGTFSGTYGTARLPVTPDAYQSNHMGNNRLDGFLASFSPDLKQLRYATYIGGSLVDYGRSLWVNSAGSVVMGGQTSSTNFPAINAFDTSRDGALDSFLALFLPSSTPPSPTRTIPSPTSTPTPPPALPGDLDKDGDVDIFDYNLLVGNFGATNCGNTADIDGDCDVDIFDYNALVSNFGKTG